MLEVAPTYATLLAIALLSPPYALGQDCDTVPQVFQSQTRPRGYYGQRQRKPLKQARSTEQGDGWSEAFLSPSEATQAPSAADAVALGHSLFLIDELVGAEERETLMRLANDTVTRLKPSFSGPGANFWKLNIALQVGREAIELADLVLRRVLLKVEQEWPALALRLFGRAVGLSTLPLEKLECKVIHEPAVNVYTAGGNFEPHEDGHALTILVPLSPEGSFTGGGTGFYRSQEDLPRPDSFVINPQPSLVLTPAAGTAMLWTRDVYHAALPVQEGTRINFVASFNAIDTVPLPKHACGLASNLTALAVELQNMADERCQEWASQRFCHSSFTVSEQALFADVLRKSREQNRMVPAEVM
jgi:hypothetical protein